MKTFVLLKNNDRKILDIYKEANNIWENELSEKLTMKDLADKLSSLQMKFENKMEMFGLNRWEAQEIFVVSGLSYYLDNTNEGSHKADKVREAFEISFCSIEVKGLSKRLAKALYLGGY
ncbi:hypothetical protein [Plesiomonas shigelloides]|uniref:hypothetical protein n=1 Tax=Plesiomonas shigelloides TaxID=703 RepID=UPI0012615543|nr:hypothetical protein [Plesiomonas shigelloides]KAB7664976.1 hypothetical protein GBN25_07650 [Plesiomonas shigelloides]